MYMKTKLLNTCYSFGAAVVIYGAWCKILHKPAANLFLTLGLLTEVTIFVIYGIMEWFTKPLTKEERISHFNDTGELTSAVKETNSILKSVFKVN